MGILRNFAKALLSTAFLLSLSIFIALFLLTKTTEYSTLKQIAFPLIEEQMNITEEQKAAILNYLKYRCLNEKEVDMDIGKKIKVSCEDVESLSKENITNYFVNKIFDVFYFEKYECKLKECLENKKFEYFLSFDFHETASELSKYFLLLTIIFGILYFISIETLESRILSFGTILILTSIPYFFIDYTSFLMPKGFIDYKTQTIIIQNLKEQASFLLYFFIVGILLLLVYFAIVLKKRGLLTKNNKKYVASKRRNE